MPWGKRKGKEWKFKWITLFLNERENLDRMENEISNLSLRKHICFIIDILYFSFPSCPH
jgi:IS4 transposase